MENWMTLLDSVFPDLQAEDNSESEEECQLIENKTIKTDGN